MDKKQTLLKQISMRYYSTLFLGGENRI